MKNKAKTVFATVLLVCFSFACTASKDDESATPKVPGVTDTQILIGSSLALEGHASYLGRQTLNGAMAYLKHLNDQGGIHGRKIEVIAYDDLGTEAIRKLEVEDFPVIVVNDVYGNDLYKQGIKKYKRGR